MSNTNADYEEIKTRILENLVEFLLEQELAAKLTPAGENGASLTVAHALVDEMTERGNDGFCEFFFMPTQEAMEGFAVFHAVITFEEELSGKELEICNRVAERINFYLDCGCFCGDISGSNYSLKISMVLPLGEDINMLNRLVQLNATQAIMTATGYCNIFEKAVSGELDFDEIEALIRG